ncbi:hypothetical protein MWH28_11945 [Natroniella sulfidigena]|uniref:hypothetical protein n=1 Tax=Natroniella sulfidigena TaxID=723921 RepID=UPI00200B3269|nr:hypothetical protein [Natroniella sulfidigena]MCK8818070.1 hypothetical protein [Natroniella sulfidigena]
MRDRFTRGLIAGVIAGLPSLLFNIGAYTLNFTNLLWGDFMGVFLFGDRPVGVAEVVFSSIAQALFLGGLGIIFVFLLPLISSQHYLLKSSIYGLAIWFISFAIPFLFQLPKLADVELQTVISNFISGLLWGLALGIVLNWLDDRLKV